MMMNRGHPENAAMRQFVVVALYDYRDGLEHENSPRQRQYQFLFRQQRDRAQSSPQRQSADITHHHRSGIRVVPEEPHRGGNQSRTKDRDFAYAINMRNVQITSKLKIAGDIGENPITEADGHYGSDRQPVKTVSQIHRIGGEYNDRHRK